ncbi:GTPase IMAP family member 4-like [Mytilus edulis]|uniref:GTPase IMAP family member 4-like n=1 Tax=Mytilus edulis TaxID=6550 RepID=UPI0039EDEC3D
MDVPTKREITIMLLGHTGAGKSRTANNLLGDKVFKVGPGGTPITEKSRSQAVERFDYRLHVIDTPGVWGEKVETEKLLIEIKKGLEIANEGVNVFLLVIEMGRAVDVHKIALRYQCLFGKEMFKYAIILFTNLDVWRERFKDDNGIDPDEHQYIKSLPEDVKSLLEDCGGRYVLFENKCTGDEMEKQLKNLMKKITERIAISTDKAYTEDMCERIDQTKEEPLRQGWKIPVVIVAGISAIAGFIIKKCL